MTAFHALPDDVRLAVRWRVTSLGGSIVSYTATGLIVATPANLEATAQIGDALANVGFAVAETCYFPLGSDNPPLFLRHRGPHQRPGDQPGYWRYSIFAPTAA